MMSKSTLFFYTSTLLALTSPAMADMNIATQGNQLDRFYCVHESKIYSVGARIYVGVGNRNEKYDCVYDKVNIPEPTGGGHYDAWIAKWSLQP